MNEIKDTIVAVKKFSLTASQVKDGLITMDKLNLGVIILGLIMFLLVTFLFLKHSKRLLSHVSGSFKDPATGQWSPKIMTAFSVATLIFITHIVWLKYAFVHNDFTLLTPILGIDYGFLFTAFAMRTVEKMQAKKIDSTPSELSKTDAPTT